MMPKYQRVSITTLGYELGPVVVTTAELEERLAPAFARLGIQPGQFEAWTGVVERRWWEPGTPLSRGATAAAQKALAKAGLSARDLGALLYCGVCRENFEPATACAVADGIGMRGGAFVYDLSNACLGVLNGIVEVANRIELGQIRAGLVVSCESSREIMEIAQGKLLAGTGGMAEFAPALATFTGGSGAVAVLLTDGSFAAPRGRRLLGAVSEVAPEFHELCQWGIKPLPAGQFEQFMFTDAVAVLKNGTALGAKTWAEFQKALNWNNDAVDKIICHQVGSQHQEAFLRFTGLAKEKDFTTFRHLGNMGTAALPITAAIAEERGVLKAGQRVAWLGIGSGLNCMMMGIEW